MAPKKMPKWLAKLPEEEQIYIMDCRKRAGPGGLLLAFLPSRSTRKAFSRRTGLRHAFSDSDPAAKAVRQRKEAEKEEVQQSFNKLREMNMVLTRENEKVTEKYK